MPTKMDLSDALRDEYNQLFAQARIRPEHAFEVAATVDRIFAPANWSQYRQVESDTGVPAFLVGVIHSLEAGLRFKCHLHNGDPLSARTVNVPAGRPVTGSPPFAWHDSAIDALKRQGLHQWGDWTLPGIAFVLERYNGWGYRRHHPHVKSPYLWSFTTIYTAGKYVADGVWSDTVPSQQCGGLALLAHMVATGRVGMPEPASEDVVGLTAEDRVEAAREAPPSVAYPGHFLKNGDTAPLLVQVRQRLAARGILDVAQGIAAFDDDLKEAVMEFQARNQDETGHPLVIDGLLGRRTWRALFGPGSVAGPPVAAVPAAGSFVEVLLKVAGGELGVREDPPDSNSGDRVDEYLASLGLSPGNSWCVAFLSWCFEQTAKRLGVPNPLPRTGRVVDLWNHFQKNQATIPAEKAVQDPRLVEPGMIFCLGSGKERGHAGLVVGCANSALTTIEGNTSKGVRQLTRAISGISLGFIKAL
jgi:lysozyme family protein